MFIKKPKIDLMTFSSYSDSSTKALEPSLIDYKPISRQSTTSFTTKNQDINLNDLRNYFMSSCNSRNMFGRFDQRIRASARSFVNQQLTPRASLIERISRAKENTRNNKRISLRSGLFKSPRVVKPIHLSTTESRASICFAERKGQRNEFKEYYRRQGSDILLDNYSKQKLKKESKEQVKKYPLVLRYGKIAKSNEKKKFAFIRIIKKN